ncbi:hypothetical protein [Microcoleus sp. F4-D5]|uniref:hypothetical protein n=1 Tax=Microcoleus sp. F4-D5 TaxID=2818760 RepID=UPI002FD466D9
MQLITLTDLSFLAHPTQLAVPIELEQEEFQLIMKQTFLKLPTEPLLLANPKVDRWIMEVSLLFPEVFEWEPPKFLVDTQFSAKLNKDVCVQINANAAFLEHQSVHLIEWAIRHPALNWCDRVKLWTAAESLSLPPENIKLTVLALHPTHPGTRHLISWDSRQHAEAKNWLASLLARQARSPVAARRTSPPALASLTDFDIEEIPELEI